ncbi:hypothetical protein I350_05513 [Cryptococcus amylolentus CBS 6273]|uniref:PH domain-containing protein n=1 Tax=Cryptococcus amylolentus CBS 6273 TaxID=1296118 RepID=A0A1E3JVT9_9TREE|nr:hypothetical protein I350_05513 [Cryptococcus amylolentus CBS 6273]
MPRPRPQPAGLGIEDELSFGSDEDLIADVGEINLPPAQDPSDDHTMKEQRASANGGSRFKLSRGDKKEERSGSKDRYAKEKKDKRNLSKAALVMDPQLESVLDLSNYNDGSTSSGSNPSLPSLTSASMTSVNAKKKGGFRSALRNLGMKKEADPIAVFASKQRLEKIRQVHSNDSFSTGEYTQSIDLSLSTYSSRRTDTTFSSHYHSPTNPNPSSTKSIDDGHSKRGSIASFPARPPAQPNTDTRSKESYPPVTKAILNKFPEAPDAGVQNGHAKSRPTLDIPSPVDSGLYSVLLPPYPTSLPSLENVSILSATVIRREVSSVPEKQRSTSLSSLAGGMGGGNNGAKKLVWTSRQMVLTSFKVGGNTPSASPKDEYPSEGDAPVKTIANLHIFSLPLNTPSSAASPLRSRNRSDSSSSPPGSSHQTELERMTLKGESTAGFWEDAGGERKHVLRIGFGYEARNRDGVEWIVEMRSAEQLREWINQIKSLSTILRAEQEGYGHAINQAYASGTVRGDDLALALSLQRRTPSGSVKKQGSQGGSEGSGDVSPAPVLAPAVAPAVDARMSGEAARAEPPLLPMDSLPRVSAQLNRLDLRSSTRRSSLTSGSPSPSAMKSPGVNGNGPHVPNKHLPPAVTPPTAPLPSLPSDIPPSTYPSLSSHSRSDSMSRRYQPQERPNPLPATVTEEERERPLTEAEKIRLEAQSHPYRATSPPIPQTTEPVAVRPPTPPVVKTKEIPADAQSVLSVPSVASGASTGASRRRAGKRVAVDVMAEFQDDYEPEEEQEPIIEDRPRAIRFA